MFVAKQIGSGKRYTSSVLLRFRFAKIKEYNKFINAITWNFLTLYIFFQYTLMSIN